MTTCLGRSCSFGLLCVSFMGVCQILCVCVSFPFGIEGMMLIVIVLIPARVSVYFVDHVLKTNTYVVLLCNLPIGFKEFIPCWRQHHEFQR